MLNVLSDGPFRYLHNAATGEMVLMLERFGSGFVEIGDEEPVRTMREWKAVARKRLGHQLITDTDGRN